MTATYETYNRLDAQLAKGGIHASSDWWHAAIRDLYQPGIRGLTAQVGRGGFKSGQECKLAINETLFGDWQIPRGERHYAVLVAENVTEASNRLRFIAEALRILKVPFKSAGEAIELRDEPLGFRVLACRVGAVSGFRAFFIGLDEVAKWSIEGANPAVEVAASCRAMTVTHPQAKEVVFSSPLSIDGFFNGLVEKGDTDGRIVRSAPTWVANPSITEARTRELETDPRIWAREYAAIPQAGALAAFAADDVTAAFRGEPHGARGEPVLLVDPTSGGGDTFAYALARWIVPEQRKFRTRQLWSPNAQRWLEIVERDEKGEPIPLPQVEPAPPVVSMFKLGGWTKFAGKLTAEAIVSQLATIASAAGARWVYGDQFEKLALETLFAGHGLKFVPMPWTQPTKQAAAERLRRWLRERTIVIEDHDAMKRQLLSFEEKIAPSGALTFSGRGHDDFAMLALLAARADTEAMLPASPWVSRRKPLPRWFTP